MPAKQPADLGQIHRRVLASVSPACPYGRNTGGQLARGRSVGLGVGQERSGLRVRSLPGRVLCCRRSLCPARGLGVDEGVSTGGEILRAARRRSFLTRPDFTVFRRVVADLREHCPAAKPVVVRTAWLAPEILGECIRRRHRFVIRLNNRMDQAQAIETTLHEWAHALAWNYSLDRLASEPGVTPEAFDLASHDEAWGCAYSRVWRVYSGIRADA
jgi:hypothetical protein